MSLFWRVVIVNAVLLGGAVLVLVVTPASVSSAPTAAEIEVLVAGTLLVIGLNVALLRRIFVPLERLTGTMRRVDPLDPGRRVTIRKPAAEVGELAKAFNDMLDRLEAERQGSARRALAATEAERLRVARELHDQVGQTLTGVVLALEEIHRRAPPLGPRSGPPLGRRAPVSNRCARSRGGCGRARWRSWACAAR